MTAIPRISPVFSQLFSSPRSIILDSNHFFSFYLRQAYRHPDFQSFFKQVSDHKDRSYTIFFTSSKGFMGEVAIPVGLERTSIIDNRGSVEKLPNSTTFTLKEVLYGDCLCPENYEKWLLVTYLARTKFSRILSNPKDLNSLLSTRVITQHLFSVQGLTTSYKLTGHRME